MTDTPALSLRRRRAVEPDDLPPVAAFSERVDPPKCVEFGRANGSGVTVLFQVPLHLRDPNPSPMDPDAFRIAAQREQHAAVGVRTAGRMAVVAAVVPLTLLTPMLAQAAPPSLPVGKDSAPSEDQTEPAPTANEGGAAESPEVSTAAPPATADKDALWLALVGEDLILVKADDSRLDGRLLGVQNGRLVLARRSDGLVVDVDPETVTGIYSASDEVGPAVETPGAATIDPDLTRKPGTGLMIGGGVLLGLSGTFFVSAALLGIRNSSYSYYGSAAAVTPLVVAGVLAAGGGIPMVIVGALRHKKLRKASERRLRASVSPTKDGGWSTSLSLRF